MPKLPFRFVRDTKALNEEALSLKQQCCQDCEQTETLNRHSFLYGNDPATKDGRVCRGQRVFCSNRGQRGGCGRTFSIFFADILPRHTVSATLLWKLLSQLLAATSVKAAAQSLGLPFVLETLYHLLQRLRQRLDAVRCWLCRQQKPPASAQSDPLLQTAEHLQSVFAQSLCPIAAFQQRFQQPLLG
jgi:hypothetical protein